MVYFGCKFTFGGSKWIISWEMYIKMKYTIGIWAILGTDNSCLPMEIVIVDGTSRTVGKGFLHDIIELFLNSFACHCVLNIVESYILSIYNYIYCQ